MGNGVGVDAADVMCPPWCLHRWDASWGLGRHGLPRRRFHLRAAGVYFGDGACLADLQVYVDRSPTGNP